MNNFILQFCLINICLLHLLENIGFLFRIAGIEESNLVAGYTFQNTLQFSSRILTFIFMPIFALLADNRTLLITFPQIFTYYLISFVLIFVCIHKFKEILNILRLILRSQLSGKTVFRSIFQRKVLISFISLFILIKTPNMFAIFPKYLMPNQKEGLKILRNFSITYIPTYSCWIFISMLITIFPERPSFLMSLSTFFTFSATIYQSIIFDPWMARYVENKELTRSIYLELQIFRLRSIFISFLISSSTFFVIKKYFI